MPDERQSEREAGATKVVELLYFDGCPSYEALLPRLCALLEQAGCSGAVTLRRVESESDAMQERFLGSPTLRVGGEDVDPGAAGRSDFGLKCRLYHSESGLEHLPPEDWIPRLSARSSVAERFDAGTTSPPPR